jgi:hypothetical protein
MTGMYDADEIVWGTFAAIAFAVVMFFALQAECEESDRRAVIRHKCTPIRHIAGQTIIVSNGKNMSVGGTSDQTCYRCPDGMEECF